MEDTCAVCGRPIRVVVVRRGGEPVEKWQGTRVDGELLCRTCADRHAAWKYRRLLERERAAGRYDG